MAGGMDIWVDEFKWSRDVALDHSSGYGGVVDAVSGEAPESFQSLEQIMLENDFGEAKIIIDFDLYFDVDKYNASSITDNDLDFVIISSYLYGTPKYDDDISNEQHFVDLPKDVADAIYDEFADDIRSQGIEAFYNRTSDLKYEYKSKEVKPSIIENISTMISEDVNEHFDVD